MANHNQSGHLNQTSKQYIYYFGYFLTKNVFKNVICKMVAILFRPKFVKNIPDSKVHGAKLGPTWVLSAPDGPHVGPMNLALRDAMCCMSTVKLSVMYLWDARSQFKVWITGKSGNFMPSGVTSKPSMSCGMFAYHIMVHGGLESHELPALYGTLWLHCQKTLNSINLWEKWYIFEWMLWYINFPELMFFNHLLKV